MTSDVYRLNVVADNITKLIQQDTISAVKEKFRLLSDSLQESPHTSLNFTALFYGQILPSPNILYLIK